jgi:tetratricopeptide (TPR) repeat protein
MRLPICLIVTIALASAATRCSGQASPAQAALALEQQGRNSEAEAAWREIQKAHPSSPEPYAHLGLLAARQEHYKEAATLYRKALALNPAMPGVRLNLGLALFKGDELKQAILEFKPLLKSQPAGSPGIQRLVILIGMAHYGLGEYAEAAPYLRQAAAGDPQNLPLRMTLAQSCMWSQQYQCVLDTYHEILTLNAESAEADMLAGEALDEMKDNAGATKMFRAAVKANPKEPNAHFGLGYLLWTQKQYAEAAGEFQAALDNDQKSSQAMLYLADSQIQLNRPAEAQPLLEKVVQLDPSLALGHLDLGIIYSDAERTEDALRELKAAAKIAPNDVNVHWRLGRLYRTMGKKDDAKIEFDKASKLNKATDEDLFKKIENGHRKPDKEQGPPVATPNP